MSEEIDMAMAYTEERKMRIKAIQRIHSLVYNLVPFVGSVATLIEGVMRDDSTKVSQSIKILTTVRAQVESDMMLNIFKPADEEPFFEQEEIEKSSSLHDLGDKNIDAMKEVLEVSAKLCFYEWNALAKELGHMSCNERRSEHAGELLAIMTEMSDPKTGERRKKEAETTH